MNRIKESQPWAGFSSFICNGFEENSEKSRGAVSYFGEDFVYLRHDGCDDVAAYGTQRQWGNRWDR